MNESACISDDIIYDTIAPTAGTLTNANDATTNLNWEINAGITLVSGYTYYTLLKVVDGAGNETIVASSPWYLVSPPDAITNLIESQRTKNQIDIAWTEPNANGPGITDYEIQYSESGGPWTTISDGVNTNLSYSHTGLTPDTDYSYRVRSSNGTFWSNWSNQLDSKTLPDVPFFDNPYKAINVGGATTCSVVSMADNNVLVYDGANLKGGSGEFSRGETMGFTCAQFKVLEGDGPFFVAGRRGSGSDVNKANMVWATSAWVGKKFFFSTIVEQTQ